MMMMEEEVMLFRPGDVTVPISSGPFVKTLFDKAKLTKFHLKPGSFAEKRIVAGVPHRSITDLLTDVENGNSAPPEVAKLFKNLRQDSSFGKVEFDEELLRKMFQVWKSNSFPLVNELVEMIHSEVALGLYTGKPDGAKHACRPNAVRIGLLDKVELRCIHPIKKGEEPTISYMLKNHNPQTRQFILKKHYDFTMDCDCDLCTDELSSGPLVDYERLEDLYNKIPDKEETRYQSILESKKEILAHCRKLYHEHDKRLTFICITLFWSLAKLSAKKKGTVPMPLLEREAVELEQRMRITFGKDSFLCSNFIGKLKRWNNGTGIALGGGGREINN